MSAIDAHLELLGCQVEESVTGMRGVVTSVCFDLYGCVQGLLNPGLDKDGKLQETYWFDVIRLQVVSPVRAMPRPDFNAPGEKGPEAKGTFH